jgi:hypothetical protein
VPANNNVGQWPSLFRPEADCLAAIDGAFAHPWFLCPPEPKLC